MCIVLQENFGNSDTHHHQIVSKTALDEHQNILPDEQITQSRQRRAVTSNIFTCALREDEKPYNHK